MTKGKFSTQQLVIIVVSAMAVLLLAALAQDAINQVFTGALEEAAS